LHFPQLFLINVYKFPLDNFHLQDPDPNQYLSLSFHFRTGGGVILSQEGTTQGDNLAMTFYSIMTTLLITTLQQQAENIKQVWLADDTAGAGRLHDLLDWFESGISRDNSIFPSSCAVKASKYISVCRQC
jgi:hypothetical protein